MYAVPLDKIQVSLSMHIKSLTFVPTDGYNKNSQPILAYSRNETHLLVPRFYGLRVWGQASVDNTSDGVIIENCEFNGTLTSVQEDCFQHTMTAFENQIGYPRGGMIVLPCGYGKTVYALSVIAKMKVRTLVIVHKTFLVQQWEQRINEFLPGVTVGFIRQDAVSVDADIVIGMVQSISRRSYDYSVFSQFGMVILDEAHHMCAPFFSKALRKIPSRYILALSATPDRKDGMNDLLKFTMGDIIFRVKRDYEVVNVSCLEYKQIVKRSDFVGNGRRPQLSKIINSLVADQVRNSMLLFHIRRLVDNDRRIIVLSDRLSQLEHLMRNLGNEYESALYVGKTPESERDVAQSKKVIFSTYQMSREGLDIKELDTLVMATPIADVEQAIGRILRKYPQKTPLVLDIMDRYPIIDAMKMNRRKFYTGQQYKVQVCNAMGKGSELYI